MKKYLFADYPIKISCRIFKKLSNVIYSNDHKTKVDMKNKKTIIKAKGKKLAVAAPEKKKLASAKKTQNDQALSDKDFQKHLNEYMKEKQSLMKKLSKR